MENKTAVEFLIEQYEEKAGTLLKLTFKELMKPEINKALEMEKQQIIDAYCADRYPKEIADDEYVKITDSVLKSAAEQYYSETFKK